MQHRVNILRSYSLPGRMSVYILMPQRVTEHVSMTRSSTKSLEANKVRRSGIGSKDCFGSNVLVNKGGTMQKYYSARHTLCDGETKADRYHGRFAK